MIDVGQFRAEALKTNSNLGRFVKGASRIACW